ncbi:MAG TPA: endonuclease III [Spirochaetota bacterium]|nr:endonuclease III [Spirochaetota bacterium]HQO40327.1 endonuclease III [Spirochaetota bacterium]
MRRDTSSKIISALEALYGDAPPDLVFRNNYELTVAVVLSAQTSDRQVNGVTGKLFSTYPDFASLACARRSDVEKIIKSTGFYRVKASNIIALAATVMERFEGLLPQKVDELMELPGVGKKSANVIISVGYGKPALAVDTHVSRIAKRLGYTESSNPLKVEHDLCAVISPGDWKKTHLLFIRHGRSTCTARNPRCTACTVSRWCRHFNASA